VSAIVYYITGHGYGHAVRSSEVIRALTTLKPDLSVYVRTPAPGWLFAGLPPGRYSHAAIDVGVLHSDSLAMDPDATAKACLVLHDGVATVLARECAFVQERQISLVAGDIPPLAFEIAARASIPSVAITNFTWDFIYRAWAPSYPNFWPLIREMERLYAQATLALTLPYACEMKMFHRREAIPWIMRASRLSREQARAKFALPPAATIVLLSFGGFGLARLPWRALARQREFYFVTTDQTAAATGNVLTLSAAQEHYEDLVRAADVVVTKPGYGIVADAIAHQVPVLYTDRGKFPEDPKLVEALTECATAAYISPSELLAGHLSPYLQRLLKAPPAWPAVETGGAREAAEKIIGLVQG
jgi:L-arabinokinase